MKTRCPSQLPRSLFSVFVAASLAACTQGAGNHGSGGSGAGATSATTSTGGAASTSSASSTGGNSTGGSGGTGGAGAGGGGGQSIRVPAEWEPQAAIWLQWPQSFESTYEPAFAHVVATILKYEDVHILTNDGFTLDSAMNELKTIGGLTQNEVNGGPTAQGYKITWHDIPNDSAWMRDNGPRFVLVNSALRIQDWGFDCWGGAFGDFPFAADDAVPAAVGAYLNLPVDQVPIVHERGDLEFNGTDTVILNWNVIGDPNRNPGLTQAQADQAMRDNYGVTRVVMLDGAPEGDLTGGHVDGIARFIDNDHVVVVDCSDKSKCLPGGPDDLLYDDAAAKLAAAGLQVIRFPIEGKVTFQNQVFDTEYMNWLVGNGFVITVGFGHPTADANAKAQLEQWFPGRDVYVIEMLSSWAAGGGVHCHTNDQPL